MSPVSSLIAPQPIGLPLRRATSSSAPSAGSVCAGSNPKRSVQIGVVRAQAEAGVGALGVGRRDLDQARGEQPLHHAHRLHEPQPLALGERREQRGGERVAVGIQARALVAAGGGEPGGAHAPVVLVGGDGHEPFGLQRTQQPAQVARVQPEPCPQRADVGRLLDLPQHARGTQRPAVREVLVLERADPLGDRAVERANLGEHISDSSQLSVRVQPRRTRVTGCGEMSDTHERRARTRYRRQGAREAGRVLRRLRGDRRRRPGRAAGLRRGARQARRPRIPGGSSPSRSARSTR